MRTLLLIAAIVLIFLIIRAMLRRARFEKEARQKVEGPKRMLRCEQCGLHFPENEAVRTADGHVYCSEEHLRLAGK